jgi:AcrR family transcriptional regulator
MADLMAERRVGAGAVTVTPVITRAGVSRGEFYDLFADREACLLAAFDLGVERAGARMARAYTAESRWRDGIRAALETFLGFLEDEPALGRLCVVHGLSGGVEVLRRRTEVLGVLWKVVDRGRLEGAVGSEELPAVVAEGVVGAVLSVIQNRLQAEDEPPLMELLGPLTSMILLPYLGPPVARLELTRPAPGTWANGGAASAAQGERVSRSGTRASARSRAGA